MSVKFLEICSDYRDRFLWPNPFQFTVVNTAQNSYAQDYSAGSAPCVEFKPLPAKTPIGSIALETGWNFCKGDFRPGLDAYRGASVGNVKIVASKTVGSVLAIKVKKITSHVEATAITSFARPSVGVLHVPGGSKQSGAYNGWILVNDTLCSGTRIIDYLDSVLLFTPQPGWTRAHRYSIRRAYTVDRKLISSVGDQIFSNSPFPRDVSFFIRVIASGQIAHVQSVSASGNVANARPALVGLSDEPCELWPVTAHHINAFSFSNGNVPFLIEFLGITVPNITLDNYRPLTGLKTLYIDVIVNSFTARTSAFISNDPNIVKTTFIADVEADEEKAFLFCRAKNNPVLDLNISDLFDLAILVKDADGNALAPGQPDYSIPAMANPELQVRLSFKLIFML